MSIDYSIIQVYWNMNIIKRPSNFGNYHLIISGISIIRFIIYWTAKSIKYNLKLTTTETNKKTKSILLEYLNIIE